MWAAVAEMAERNGTGAGANAAGLPELWRLAGDFVGNSRG